MIEFYANLKSCISLFRIQRKTHDFVLLSSIDLFHIVSIAAVRELAAQ